MTTVQRNDPRNPEIPMKKPIIPFAVPLLVGFHSDNLATWIQKFVTKSQLLSYFAIQLLKKLVNFIGTLSLNNDAGVRKFWNNVTKDPDQTPIQTALLRVVEVICFKIKIPSFQDSLDWVPFGRKLNVNSTRRTTESSLHFPTVWPGWH